MLEVAHLELGQGGAAAEDARMRDGGHDDGSAQTSVVDTVHILPRTICLPYGLVCSWANDDGTNSRFVHGSMHENTLYPERDEAAGEENTYW